MSQISENRKIQLRHAHQALDRGDRAAAAAWWFTGIEDFLTRANAAFFKDIGKGSGPKLTKVKLREKSPPNTGYKAERADKRKRVREILERFPDIATAALAERAKVSHDLAAVVRREMGLPAHKNGRNLRPQIEALLAQNPQITNLEISQQLHCTQGTARDIRRKIANAAKKETTDV